MKKVAVIGHFGIGLNLINGQTIKTKIITEAIENKYNKKVKIVDTYGGIRAIIPVILGCIISLVSCKNIIVMLTENGLRVAIPILVFFNNFFNRKLHYIVIGGWLSSFLESQVGLEKKLKEFNYIYVETNTMKESLEKKGFQNIIILPNCKKLKILNEEDLVYNNKEPFKLCTFSRVMKEKGIEDAINIIKNINNDNGRTVFTLDIYGQVDAQQVEWFKELKSSFSSYINYKGEISFERSVEVLKDYFCLLFPTRFFTEGIPGTIIDGYAAGVPVISAKWESFEDVVDDYKSGIGFEINNMSEFRDILIKISREPDRFNAYKKYCLKKSKEFTVENALKNLFINLK